MKPISHRDVVKALRAARCVKVSEDGDHEKWRCPCGQHSANIPRHRNISVGVVRSTIIRMECLEKGWLA